MVARTWCVYLALQAPQKLIGEEVRSSRHDDQQVDLKLESEAKPWIQEGGGSRFV